MSDTPKVKRGKLRDLKPLVNNPNAGSERGQYMLEESFTQAGAGRSILIAANGDILAGNHASEAYGQLLGNEDVLIVETDGKTLVAVQRTDIPSADDPKGKTLIVADNRASDFHEYDAQVIAGLLETDEALIKHYFMQDELDALLASLQTEEPAADPGAQVDRAAELQQKWQVERGQVWEVPSKATPGKCHRVMCGDSTDKADVEKLMDGERANLVVTDPPYGVSYADKNEYLNAVAPANRIQTPIENDHASKEDTQAMWKAAFEQANTTMQPGAAFYCFMPQGGDQMMMMMMMMSAGIEPRHELIWLKNNHVLGRADYAYKHEPILYAWKEGGHKYYGGFQTSIFEFDKPLKSDLHPTMKPVELIQKLIENSSLRNGIVYDLFLGSGTTLVACEQTARIGYGMEIAPEYCNVILERLSGLGLTPRKVSDG